MKRRALILEPHAQGHHASYLRWLAMACAHRGWDVLIATTATASSHAALSSLRADLSNVEIFLMAVEKPNDPAGSQLRLIRRELAYWKSFRDTIAAVRQHTQIDFIILPYVDYCFHALSLLGTPFHGIPWCAISMRLAVAVNKQTKVPELTWKWRMARRILQDPDLKALFVINPSVQDMPAHWLTKKMKSRLRYLPDPAENSSAGTRADSRAALGISASAVVVLVFGSIDERKGINSLVAAVLSDEALGELVVILAGHQSESMRIQMRERSFAELQSRNRLMVLDRYLGESERASLFAVADVVWIGYRNHIYMSGVLVFAGRASLPVVGTSDGEIGMLIVKHRIGSVARIDRLPDVCEALRAMLDDSARAEMGRRAKALFADHTPEKFGVIVLNAFDG